MGMCSCCGGRLHSAAALKSDQGNLSRQQSLILIDILKHFNIICKVIGRGSEVLGAAYLKLIVKWKFSLD